MDGEQRLRWQTVDQEAALPGLVERVTHPEFAGIDFLHVRAKSLVNHVPGARGMPFEWTINVYRGCTHACVACFARPTHTYLGLDAGRDFESVIVVKVNAVERLRAELGAPGWGRHHIALGTNTDPYQRCEGRYRLTRGVVETLTAAGNPFSVLTRSPLALRDMEAFVAAQSRCGPVAVNFSVPTLDEAAWHATEPGAPHPRRRLEAVAALNDAGVPSGVMVAPIMPGISDSQAQLEEVVKSAVAAGATSISPIVLHLRPGVKEQFMPWLERQRPDLVDRYRQLYRGSYAPKDVQREIGDRVRRLAERHGGPRKHRPARSARRVTEPAPIEPVQPPGEQLTIRFPPGDAEMA